MIRSGNKYYGDTLHIKGFDDCYAKFYDLNGDGYEDLFIAGLRYDNTFRQRGYIQVYKNNKGKMEFYKEIRFKKNFYIYFAEWADINKDGKPDVVMHTNEGFYILYNNMETSSFDPGDIGGPAYTLSQNYPNPFNPATTISYTIPKVSFVELKIFDMLGREISTLISQEQSAGEYSIKFDGSPLASGMYIYRLKAGEYTKSHKMLILK